MKYSSQNLFKILFVKSILLFLVCGIYSYTKPSYNVFVFFTASFGIFIIQLMLIFSELKKRLLKILWIFSYIIGISLLFNLNKQFFSITWKYQLILFLFFVFCSFSIRFFSNVSKRVIILSFLNNVLFCGYLFFIVWNNFENEIYSNIAKGLIIYMIVYGVFISVLSKSEKKKANTTKEK